MKNLNGPNHPTANPAIRTPAILIVAATLAVTFWFMASSTGLAVSPNQCTVCHKRTTTLVLACNSLEYQRHIDHGDPATACPASRAEKDRATRGE
jgi:hypothetical protein